MGWWNQAMTEAEWKKETLRKAEAEMAQHIAEQCPLCIVCNRTVSTNAGLSYLHADGWAHGTCNTKAIEGVRWLKGL